MRPVVVTFPDHDGLGQGTTPYLSPTQAATAATKASQQQAQLPPYLRRTG